MKIVVAVKQVPLHHSVRFNPKTKRVVREDVESATNPLDLLALGHALGLREAHGGEIVALTMGPPAARACLEDAIARGADRGILLTDRRFAGADTLATVRALARAIDDEGADLVLLGRGTLDGATAQVAPQLAELMGRPQVTQATALRVTSAGLEAERELDAGSATVRLPLPAVVSILRGPAPPAARAGSTPPTAIQERSAEDLGGGPRDFGTRGSPTFVRDVRVLASPVQTVVMNDLERAVDALARRIAAAGDEPEPDGGAGVDGGTGSRVIWALAERLGDGALNPVSLQAIACGRSVAAAYDARVLAVLLCDDPADLPAQLVAHGADGVLVVQDLALRTYSTESFTAALCAAIQDARPDAVIGPWTADGRDYVPRAAARLGLGLTGDVVGLEVPPDDDPDLLWIKPAWSGTVEAPVIAHTTPSMGTLRPGAVRALEPAPGREAPVQTLRPELDGAATATTETVNWSDDAIVERAPLVVCVGDDADDALVGAAGRLAREHGGALAGTAAAVDAGLVPAHAEVGLLRRSVSPRLFVALGRHTAADLGAARRSGTVVVVGGEAVLPPDTRVDISIDLPAADVVDRLLAAAGAR